MIIQKKICQVNVTGKQTSYILKKVMGSFANSPSQIHLQGTQMLTLRKSLLVPTLLRILFYLLVGKGLAIRKRFN
jgi:hypothetical protein